MYGSNEAMSSSLLKIAPAPGGSLSLHALTWEEVWWLMRTIAGRRGCLLRWGRANHGVLEGCCRRGKQEQRQCKHPTEKCTHCGVQSFVSKRSHVDERGVAMQKTITTQTRETEPGGYMNSARFSACAGHGCVSRSPSSVRGCVLWKYTSSLRPGNVRSFPTTR